MKLSANFKNGLCKLDLIPEDEWEEKLLGAVAKGGNTLEAHVTYKSEAYTYGKCSAVYVQLQATNAVTE